MNKSQEEYYKVLNEIKRFEGDGLFSYKGLSIPNILLAEIIAHDLNENKGFFSLYEKIKSFLKYNKRKIKFDIKVNPEDDCILIFVNTHNQWASIEPVFSALSRTRAKIIILTSKDKLHARFLRLKYPTVLLRGFEYKIEDFKTTPHTSDYEAIIRHYIPQIRFLEKAIRQVFSHTNPKYVLVGNDLTYEGRVVTIIAKQLNIPTGIVQHGTIDRLSPMFGRIISDQIFVYGNKAFNALVAVGLNPEHIEIAGWTQKEVVLNQLKGAERFNDFAEDFIVISLSGHGHSTSSSHHFQIISFLKQLQHELQLNFCIKLHPKDKRSYYREFDKNRTILLNNEDLAERNLVFHEILKSAKLAITGASSSVFDALVVQIPVITVDFCDEYSDIGFIQDGLTLHVKTYDELKATVTKILDNNYSHLNSGNNAIEEYFHNYYENNYSSSNFISDKILEKANILPSQSNKSQ